MSLANIATAIQGKICEDRRTLANGKTATYHNLQYWSDGKNCTIRIPEEKLGEFEETVKNGRKARPPMIELTQVDAESILSSASPLKTKIAEIALKGAVDAYEMTTAFR